MAIATRAKRLVDGAKRVSRRHPRLARLATALAIYIPYECALRGLRMPMVLYWGKMQLLDPVYLAARPFDSLLYLHAQPPVLNTLALIVLHGSHLTGLSETAVANGLFAALSFGCFYALLRVAQLATGSRIAAAACGALLLLNPAFAFYRHRLLYEIPALLAVLLVSWSWLAFVRHGRRVHGVALALSLGLLCLTKSLFHPLFALLVALLALAARRAVSGGGWIELFRGHAAAVALGVALVLLWPAKNWLVFDHFVSSSWLGFNLTVRTPAESYAPFREFVDEGKIDPSLQARIDAFEGVRAGDDLSVVRDLKKPTYPKIANWNHLAVLYTSGELARRGMEWRLEHPVEWLAMTTGRYFMTMRPSFIYPYSANTVFSGGPRYDRYAARYRDILHPDLRPWLERVAPGWFVHRYAVMRDKQIPYTPFAFAYPVFLLACAIVAWRMRRTPAGWFLILCALASAWTVFVPALTDGAEGNRMRLASAPLVCVGLCVLLQAAWHRWRGARGA